MVYSRTGPWFISIYQLMCFFFWATTARNFCRFFVLLGTDEITTFPTMLWDFKLERNLSKSSWDEKWITLKSFQWSNMALKSVTSRSSRQLLVYRNLISHDNFELLIISNQDFETWVHTFWRVLKSRNFQIIIQISSGKMNSSISVELGRWLRPF